MTSQHRKSQQLPIRSRNLSFGSGHFDGGWMNAGTSINTNHDENWPKYISRYGKSFGVPKTSIKWRMAMIWADFKNWFFETKVNKGRRKWGRGRGQSLSHALNPTWHLKANCLKYSSRKYLSHCVAAIFSLIYLLRLKCYSEVFKVLDQIAGNGI